VAAVGAVLAAIFGFLWAREVATGREPKLPEEGPDPATDGAPPIPADQGEAAMPAPEPGERFPRNKFLEASTLGLGAIIGAIVTLPAVAAALVPGFVKQKSPGVDLGPSTTSRRASTTSPPSSATPRRGYISAHVGLHPEQRQRDGKPSFTCISNRCVHLGCPSSPAARSSMPRRRRSRRLTGRST
jgi:hypothetical protein